jgi:hypothetical protein
MFLQLNFFELVNGGYTTCEEVITLATHYIYNITPWDSVQLL